MFLRSKKQQLPSYIEGTQGRYVRRASPPPVPSLTSHPIVKRATISGADSQKPMGSSASVPKQLSQQDLMGVVETEDGIRRPSIGFIPTEPPFSSSTLYSQPQNGRHLLIHQHRFDQDDGKRSPQPGALSSHSFNDPRREHHRKPLTTSHSIGNVESFMDQLDPIINTFPEPQQRFVSLQSLPGRTAIGSSIIGGECLISGSPHQDELPLPLNWDTEVTPDGIQYYVDHNNRRTHWIHPLAHENLPPGWRKGFGDTSGVIYYNELDGRTQLEHPGFAAPIHRTESMLTTSRRTESTVAHLNIIQQEEIPEWLLMYSKADEELDHLLEWQLFPTLQLEQFERMIYKLYKQEVIDTVRRYERMRTILRKEIVRRTEPRSIPMLNP